MIFRKVSVCISLLSSLVAVPLFSQVNDPKKIREEILDTVFSTMQREGNKVIDLNECFFVMMKKGIRGCDEYAEIYVTQKDFEGLRRIRQGTSYFGIGTQLISRNGRILLVPFDGLPAMRAGIRAGDILLRVDTTLIPENSLAEEVVNFIRGAEGTEVEITFLRNGSIIGPLKIRRVKVQLPLIVSGMIDSLIGFVKINQFGERFATEIDSVLSDLRRSGARGLIFDLRNNPGGLLQATLGGFALNFSPRLGDTILTEMAKGEPRGIFVSDTAGVYRDLPIVVITNRFSASASEIFAGLLQEFNDAKVVGDTTFGKGSVQGVFEKRTSDGTIFSFKLTVAEYFLGNTRRKVDGIGIAPNYFVHDSLVRGDTTLSGVDMRKPRLDLIRDGQLREAMRVLKGMMVKKS